MGPGLVGGAIMIDHPCPACGHPLSVDNESAGQRIQCPRCRQALVVPPAPHLSATLTHPPDATAAPATQPHGGAANLRTTAEQTDGASPTGIVRVEGYEILVELARGGMGVVYQARQAGLGRLVALKMILAGGHAGPAELARFRAEAEAIARLQHPNIVQVYEVGEHEGRPFFSLEFCGGGGLDRKLSGTPLPPQEAAALVQTLARAVHAAHEKGVIHRDLKPANVLLAADGTPKISDFGLAKKLDEAGQTQSGAVLGTPSYMAPEQAGGKSSEIGPAADVYALGAILYECLTGRPPFKGVTPLDTLLLVRTAEPVAPSQLQPQTPRDLETICLKCLRKEPAKRYGGAAALADDLGRFQRGEPIAARPVGPAERVGRWCRRNPALAAALAAVLLVFAAGATVSTILAVLAGHRADDAVQAQGRADREAENARQEKAAAIAANNDLQKSHDQLLTATARSLLRPLRRPQQSFGPFPLLSDLEIEALWELASSPENDLHVRFIEDALREAVPTRHLRDRAAFALQASVGLDPARRAQVEQLLGDRLQNQPAGSDQQFDIALTLAQLGVANPANAEAAAKLIIQAIAKETDPVQLHELAEGLTTLASRLDPKAAGMTATALSEAGAKTRDLNQKQALFQCLAAVKGRMDPNDLATDPYSMAQVLSAAAPRLEAKKVREAAGALTQALDKTTDPNGLLPLAQALSALAPRMEPKEAGEAAAALTQATARVKPPFPLDACVPALAAMAARMEPKDAAAVLSQAMAKTASPDQLRTIALALSAAAARMEPRDAAAACGPAASLLTEHMASTANTRVLGLLAEGLAAVALWMDAKDAQAARVQAAGVLSQAMGRQPMPLVEPIPITWRPLAQGLAAVAPEEAAAAFTQAMATTTDAATLGALAQDLSAAAMRMEPQDAAAARGQAAVFLAQRMASTTDANTLGALAQGLSAVAPGLEPKEARATAALLTQTMAATTNGDQLAALAQGLSAAAARMRPQDASAECAQAAARLIPAVAKSSFPFTQQLQRLAQRLSSLAAHLEPKEARVTAALVTEAMSKATDQYQVGALAQALSATAARMGRQDAAEACRPAAALLAKGMTKATLETPALVQGLSAVAPRLAPNDIKETAASITQLIVTKPSASQVDPALVQALSAVAARMGRQEAAEACRPPAAFLTRAVAKATWPDLSRLAQGLSALGPLMGPNEVREAADALVPALAKTTDGTTSDALAQSLSTVLSQVGPDEPQLRIAALVAVLGSPANGFPPIGGFPVLQSASEPLPSGLPTTELVELLKHPLCVGKARRSVLDVLGWRYGRRFDDQWDFVEFAEAQKLGLDFTSPP
jgi:hypothetical protein